ncbi:TPA: protein YnaN [Escherichia coli]
MLRNRARRLDYKIMRC